MMSEMAQMKSVRSESSTMRVVALMYFETVGEGGVRDSLKSETTTRRQNLPSENVKNSVLLRLLIQIQYLKYLYTALEGVALTKLRH